MEFVPVEDNFLSIGEDVVKEKFDESLYSLDVGTNILSHHKETRLNNRLNSGLKSDRSQDADTENRLSLKTPSKPSEEPQSQSILKDTTIENDKKDTENEESIVDVENRVLNKESSEQQLFIKCNIYDLQLPPYGVKMLSTSHAGCVADENNTCMDFGTFVERSGILSKSSKKFEESNVCNTDTPKTNLELQSIMKKESSMDTKCSSKNVHFGFPVAWMKYYTEIPDENASTASTEILFSDDEEEENESSPSKKRNDDQEVPLSDGICEPCNKRICLENEDSSKFIPSFNFPDVITIPSLDIFTKTEPPVGQDISRDACVHHDEYHQHHHDSTTSNSSYCKELNANGSKPTDIVATPPYSCQQSSLQHTTSNDDDATNMGAADKGSIKGQHVNHSQETEQHTNGSIVPFQNPLRNHGESMTPDQRPDRDMDANLECMDDKMWSWTRETDDILQQNSPVNENDEGTILIRNTSEDTNDPSNHYTDFIEVAWDKTTDTSTDTEETRRSRHGEMQIVPENVGSDKTSVIEDGTRITSHRVCSSIFHLGEEALLDEVTLSPLCIADSPSKIFLAKCLIESDETPFYNESNIYDFPQLTLSDTNIQNPEISLPLALPPKETPCEKECFCYVDIDGESCSSQISDTPTEVQPLAKSLKSASMTSERMKESQNCSLSKEEKESSSKEDLQENEGALQTKFQHLLEKHVDELDGPELLHMAMQLMETALTKTKKPLESKSVAAVNTVKALPAFTWQKFTYKSQSVVQSSICEEPQEAADTPQAVNQYRKLYINKSCCRPMRVGLSKRQRSHSTVLHQPYYIKPGSTSRDHCQEVPNRAYEKEECQEEY